MKKQTPFLFIFNLFLITTSLALFGCAKKADSGTGSTGSTKAIASSWVVSNGAWTVDWSNANLNNTGFSMTITLSNGGKCTCTATVSGTNSSGGCNVSSCNYTSGSNPDCAGNGNFGVCASGNYTNNGTNLSFSGSGAIYH